MTKLKLGAIPDDKPVKLSIELSAEVHGDLIAYAKALSQETGQQTDAKRIIAPMLARFMASDRAFVQQRKTNRQQDPTSDGTT
ncbi:DUF2274 domain-containing protein [Gymnodinialimonas sp.]